MVSIPKSNLYTKASSPFLLQQHQTPQTLHHLHCEGTSWGYSSLWQSGVQNMSSLVSFLLMKPYPFLTLNHLTVPKTFVAGKQSTTTSNHRLALEVGPGSSRRPGPPPSPHTWVRRVARVRGGCAPGRRAREGRGSSPRSSGCVGGGAGTPARGPGAGGRGGGDRKSVV